MTGRDTVAQRRNDEPGCRPDAGGISIWRRAGLPPVPAAASVLPACGVVAEAVPRCDVTNVRFTTRFEEAVGVLVRRCDKTSVQERSHWVTVGQIQVGEHH